MLIDRSSDKALLNEVERLFTLHYPRKNFGRVKHHFEQIASLFKGSFPGYRACNTEYHNFCHTGDTFLATMRLIDGYNLCHHAIPKEVAALLLSAALFHDTGYIQKDWDTLGTGAKYIRQHIERSKEFVRENQAPLMLTDEEVAQVEDFIEATSRSLKLSKREKASEWRGFTEVVLGAADLIAQMADRLYLEKLLFLYYEFREAEIEGYTTEFDIIRRTLDFYETACEQLTKTYRNVHQYAYFHFKERFNLESNLYLDSIEHNIEYIKKIIADSSCNFRAKLHRIPN